MNLDCTGIVNHHSNDQPRPQGFSRKKWVGPAPGGAIHFLREKPWGRGCLMI